MRRIAAGSHLTVAVTTGGRVFQMGVTGASSGAAKNCPWEGATLPELVRGQLQGGCRVWAAGLLALLHPELHPVLRGCTGRVPTCLLRAACCVLPAARLPRRYTIRHATRPTADPYLNTFLRPLAASLQDTLLTKSRVACTTWLPWGVP